MNLNRQLLQQQQHQMLNLHFNNVHHQDHQNEDDLQRRMNMMKTFPKLVILKQIIQRVQQNQNQKLIISILNQFKKISIRKVHRVIQIKVQHQNQVMMNSRKFLFLLKNQPILHLENKTKRLRMMMVS